MAAYNEPRTPLLRLRPRALAAKRIGCAFKLQNVKRQQSRGAAANADFIWLNTPSKAHKAACASVASYNHAPAPGGLSTKGVFQPRERDERRCGPGIFRT